MSSKSSSTPTNSSASVQAKEDDQWYNMNEQSSLEKAPSRPKEDDQPYNMKEQSPQEKAPSKVQKEDQPYKLKKQIPLVKTHSKIKDDDQNPLGKTPGKVSEIIATFESRRLPQGSTTKAPSKEENSESIHSQDLGSSNLEQNNSSESNPDLLLDERQPSDSITELIGEVTDDELSRTIKKPESSHSSGDGSSRGPNGQVMKIVIMVGVGLLLLFTRKRKSR